MVKKTVKYVDFNNVEREEDLYFNLSLTEAIEMETKDPNGSFGKKLEGLINNSDVAAMLEVIEWVIQKTYGVRTEDGRSFVKNEEQLALFKQSAAYQQLYIDLLDDPDEAVKFINALVPTNLPKAFQNLKAIEGSST